MISGRTVGIRQKMVMAGAGWPSAWAEYMLAPTSRFNIGFRGTLLFASPIMGFETGVGGEASIPMRLHLFGKGKVDIAVSLTPDVVLGQAALTGQKGEFRDEFGMALRVMGGGLVGVRLSQVFTLALGAGGEFGWVNAPNVVYSDTLFAAITFMGGFELLLDYDVVLFAQVTGGVGFAPDRMFDGHSITRVAIGIAYLL